MDRLLVGTSKGLVIFQDDKEINYEYEGLNVTCLHKKIVAITHKHWGVKLFNEGLPIAVPRFNNGELSVNGAEAKLKEIWHIQDGGKRYPNRLWLAAEPGSLFLSENGGSTWHLVKSLWEHPTRTLNKQWFGAGKDLPFIHSINVHPENNDCIYVSVSCAGIFKSMDSGLTWDVINTGLRAEYLPNPHPFAGYDPHQVLIHPQVNQILWQQNHCGVYRTTNGGQNWTELSEQYGFCIAIDEIDPDQAWIIPVENETTRIPKDKRLQVLHTNDGGKSWSDSSIGLPKENFYGIVLRNGFTKKANQMAFGTTNGNIYFSDDNGKSWRLITSNLAKVNYLSFQNEH